MLRVHTGNPRVLIAHRLLRIDRFAQFAQASLEVMWVYDFNKSSFEYISPSFHDLFWCQLRNFRAAPAH